MINLGLDRILLDDPIIDFDPMKHTDDEIVSFLTELEAHLFMLYDDGYIDCFFWDNCRERNILCRAIFAMVVPMFSDKDNRKIVKCHIKFINKYLKGAVECEMALDISGIEFQKHCDSCSCTCYCKEIYQAVFWLQEHESDICGKFYEEVLPIYTKLHPGHSRPFMMAWCDLHGGI